MDAETALRRAVSELIQITSIYTQEEKEEDRHAIDMLQNVPRFRDLIGLTPLLDYNAPLLEDPAPMTYSPHDQIAQMVINLNRMGYELLTRTLHEFENNCYVTYVYVPGLERFNLVRTGIPVIPQRYLHARKHLPSPKVG